MYKGFRLENLNFGNSIEHYYNKGLEMYSQQKNLVHETLDSFFLHDKSLDGQAIVNSWFPQINAHVFLSHSHNDEKQAIALAGFLFEQFNIITFIDSCIWGYANKLIKILDDEFSWLDRNNNLYSYEKVMQSTSHVHMMLSTALSMMIDKTECLIFYDTPNSIKPYQTIDKTESPWIYSEIAISQIIQITIPQRLMQSLNESELIFMSEGGAIEKSLKIKYPVLSNRLIPITGIKFNAWCQFSNIESPEDALDKLYSITENNFKKTQIN